VDAAIWLELKTYDSIGAHRRNLQRLYVDKLIDLQSRPGKDYPDVAPLVQGKLTEIRDRLRRTTPKVKDKMTSYHLRYILDRIEKAVH
jgi:hypothetical protein